MERPAIPSWQPPAESYCSHYSRAVFLGRRGGVSSREFATLNLSFAVGDDRRAVEHNWALVRAAFPNVRRWVRMRQVHGTAVRVVDEGSPDDAAVCDGLVTALPDVALCVLTADCVPALIASAGGAPVAAVHAGWRGTVGRVLARAVQVITTRFGVPAESLWVALGPSIGPCCYAVGPDVVRMFEGAGLGTALRLDERGRWFADLRSANRLILVEAGVPSTQVVDVGGCTACLAEDFFSHRRQRGEAGRQLAFIVCGNDPLQLEA